MKFIFYSVLKNLLLLILLKDYSPDLISPKINGLHIYSRHAPSNATAIQCTEDCSSEIISHDFKVWVLTWKSRVTNTRRKILMKPLAELSIVIAKFGFASTFRGRKLGSIVDLTYVGNGYDIGRE